MKRKVEENLYKDQYKIYKLGCIRLNFLKSIQLCTIGKSLISKDMRTSLSHELELLAQDMAISMANKR